MIGDLAWVFGREIGDKSWGFGMSSLMVRAVVKLVFFVFEDFH